MIPFEPYAEASRPFLELLKRREGMNRTERAIAAAPPATSEFDMGKINNLMNELLRDLKKRMNRQ